MACLKSWPVNNNGWAWIPTFWRRAMPVRPHHVSDATATGITNTDMAFSDSDGDLPRDQ
jgi:hypothetical protein